MLKKCLFCFFSILTTTFGSALAQEERIGYSGLPVPRYVNLKSDETWGRVGPSFDYPVRFELRQRGLPVKVIAETRDNNWRQVQDHEGDTMWIHRSQLVSSDMALVKRGEGVPLRSKPDPRSRVRAKVADGVIAKVEQCELSWCRIRASDFRGWVPRSTLWGVNN